jgi:NAD+ kinase
VTKPGHARAAALASDIRHWLEQRSEHVTVLAHPVGNPDCGALLRHAAKDARAVLVLGGDGTFIGVARHLAGPDLPFMGLNLGRIGFLIETPADQWPALLQEWLHGELHCGAHTLLSWQVLRDGAPILQGCGVNDVVLGRGALARIFPMHLSVRRAGQSGCPEEPAFEEVGWVRADGIVVASSLGSSAYSLSAGGSLVHPDVAALLVTPVAPFLTGLPPLVLPGDAAVCLRGETPGWADIALTVDGQDGYALRSGDRVVVTSLPGALRILRRSRDTYLRALVQHGFVKHFDPTA